MTNQNQPPEKQAITEEMGVHKAWMEEARKVTPETLAAFTERVMNGYEHDYGTVCHAISAVAVASAWAANRMDQGGITGFQAGAIMWGFIQGWQQWEGPLRLIKWEDALYPQYGDKFQPTITPSTLEWLKAQAAEKLTQGEAHPDVRAHWELLAAGGVPFGLTVLDD